MQQGIVSSFSRYEFLIPFFIFLLFLTASLPGISWGAPALWNPDELIWRVDMALGGYMQFDVTEPDFNYPSLPKYVMYAIGTITYGLGRETFAFVVASRMFSAFLGALAGVLVYYLARMVGADKWTAGLAGLFYIASGIAAANGRFAHNDLYLQLFSVLCVFFSIQYQYKKTMIWLYASFFSVGLAASSKYTGGSLILLPVAVQLFSHWREIPKNWHAIVGRLFLGGIISYLAYGLGTPKSLLDPINYFTNVFTALENYPQYGFNFGTAIGLYGQWGVFKNAVGIFLYYVFIFAFIWFVFRLILWKMRKGFIAEKQAHGIMLLIAAVLIFDLPFMISVNYIDRYFIPFVPFLAILGACFLSDILQIAKEKRWIFVMPVIGTLMIVGMIYSTLRLVSIALLFLNDSRIPASEYIATIRGYGKGIEYTLYPPKIDKKRFTRAHNYPIYFVKYPDDVVPTGGRFVYNQGERGLLERKTDYFVIDSYTYERFYSDSVCETNPVECDFFKRLIDGKVESFQLLEEFDYDLPPYMPKVTISAVNPDVLIFERVR